MLFNPFPSAGAVRNAAAAYSVEDDTAVLAAGCRLSEGIGSFDDFLEIGRWKARERTQSRLRRNDPKSTLQTLRDAASRARAGDWPSALASLIELDGVQYPTATALLCCMLDGEFPIIDFRALETLGHSSPQTAAYSKRQVHEFVSLCLKQSAALGVSVREYDRALWQSSKDKRTRRNAYVTLVTNANFALGAGALLRSLALTGSSAERVVMVTGGVPEESVALLRELGARIEPVDLLPMSVAFNTAHGRDELHRAAPFTKGGKPAFHTPLDNFVKLRLWQLDYDRVVFLDADTLVLRNIDRLFDYPEFSAAPNVYESLGDFHRMNSGVFTARPDPATFAALMARLDAPGVFWRRTDQTFLQEFFPDWHGLPVFDNMLQYVWLNLPELWDWASIRVLHYQYEKPWQAPHPKAAALAPLIALWQAYASDGPVPDLTDLPSPPGR